MEHYDERFEAYTQFIGEIEGISYRYFTIKDKKFEQTYQAIVTIDSVGNRCYYWAYGVPDIDSEFIDELFEIALNSKENK